jgi:CPA2 family monovalent cation:H+ antiporter-2
VSGFLGLTPAYGAFLGGLVLGNSGTAAEREALARDTRPIQSVLMMAFFLSIGLLIDLRFIWDNLGVVLLLVFLVTVFKTAMNTAIFRILGQSWPQAFLLGVMLAQIGEFSFLLARNGLDLALIGQYEMRLVVAVTVLSLAISPIWIVTARRLHETTAQGFTGLGELLRSVYGKETDFVAAVARRASPAFAFVTQRIALVVATIRIRLKFKPSNENVAKPSAEVLPPEEVRRDAS